MEGDRLEPTPEVALPLLPLLTDEIDGWWWYLEDWALKWGYDDDEVLTE